MAGYLAKDHHDLGNQGANLAEYLANSQTSGPTRRFGHSQIVGFLPAAKPAGQWLTFRGSEEEELRYPF